MTLKNLDRDLEDNELRELEQFLASSALVETSMDLFGVDGYFTAILSGPRTLMPSEWIPWLWDSDRGEVAPEFEDMDHAQRILGLLMCHYNSVARSLMTDPESFEPIYNDGDVQAASSWCAGYLCGMRFDREAWASLLVGKPRWFAPILSLGTEDEDSPSPSEDQIERWTKGVGSAVAKIHGYWLAKRHAQPPGVTPDSFPFGAGQRECRPTARAGRNDPCPCGSGRKFKRCCGASGPSS